MKSSDDTKYMAVAYNRYTGRTLHTMVGTLTEIKATYQGKGETRKRTYDATIAIYSGDGTRSFTRKENGERFIKVKGN